MGKEKDKAGGQGLEMQAGEIKDILRLWEKAACGHRSNVDP